MKKFGAHVSSEGYYPRALKKAIENNFTAIQIFIGAPQRANVRVPTQAEAEIFKALKEEHKIFVVIHMPYILNTCHTDKLDWIKASFKKAVEVALMLGVDGLVWHPGSHKDQTVEQGIKNFQDFTTWLLEISEGKLLLLPEVCAGKGTALGNDIPRLLQMIGGFPENLVKICLDTSHAWAAGYNLSDPALLEELKVIIGDRLGLIHFNNNPTSLGSRRDLHSSVCVDGGMSSASLKYFAEKFSFIPFILERDVEVPIDELDFLRGIE